MRVETYVEQCLAAFLALLDQRAVLLEIATEEETEVLNEVLLVVASVLERLANVGRDGQHLLQLLHGQHEELHELLVVLLGRHAPCKIKVKAISINLHPTLFNLMLTLFLTDFRQALECDVAKERHVEELEDERVDEFRFEDVTERNPVEELEQRVQRCSNEGRVL